MHGQIEGGCGNQTELLQPISLWQVVEHDWGGGREANFFPLIDKKTDTQPLRADGGPWGGPQRFDWHCYSSAVFSSIDGLASIFVEPNGFTCAIYGG